MAVTLVTGRQMIGNTSNAGSFSISIPASAKMVLVFWSGWTGAARTMSSAAVNGQAMTIHSNLSGGATATGCGCASVLTSVTGTGTQTFAWDFSGTTNSTEGCPFKFVYLTADGIPTFRHSAGIQWDDTATQRVVVNSNTTDVVVGVVQSYSYENPNGAPGSSGQTVIDNDESYNDEVIDTATEDTPGSSTTTFSGTGFYGDIVAASFYDDESAPPATTGPSMMLMGVGR